MKPISPPTVVAIMVHVPNPKEGLAWYERAFPGAKRHHVAEFDVEYLMVGAVCIEVVSADAKVSSGAAGSVVYWQVESLPVALARMRSLGATLYRGPMQIEGGLHMCQVRDPWGNCIGLRGPGEASCELLDSN